ncbi:GntR family transcriptional regulator [Solwaraspora sp. WMMB335]|uniref:GntR family transcriptional regulator n=1 Tax=Solwaraspora sp. WMMB335 TaxID=3404118 RepID=UPI003B93057B
MAKEKPSGARTLTEDLHHRIRADILAGRLVPGRRLRLTELQQQYGASLGVVREALIRLAGQGFVDAQPQVGFSVTALSRDDLSDLTEARVAIETLVLDQSITHGDTRWEADLVAAHHLLDRTPERDATDPGMVSEQWATTHLAFHRALLDGCPNRRLRETAAALRLAAELYRTWSQTTATGQTRDIRGEHAGLLAAALDRDHARGRRLLAAHIRCTTEILLGLGLAGDPGTGSGAPVGGQ